MATKSNRTAAPVNKASDTDAATPAPVADPATDTNVAVQGGAAAQVPTNDTPENTEPTTDVAQSAATNEASTNDTPEVQPVDGNLKRPELNALATEAGLMNVGKYKTKDDVISAIERVRAGEDASTVDSELAPVADDKGGDVEVTVSNPFYDLQGKAHRAVGQSYKTTETRAAELRGRGLIK